MTDAATPQLLPELLSERVASDPDGVALRVGDTEVLTHGDWGRRSNAAASGLVERGLGLGDRVALVFPNDRWADYAVAYLAVLKAGAVAVPLGSRFSGPELERALAHAKPALVVSSVAELEAGHGQGPVVSPAGPDDLCEILYTSGTTGMPKGVACTHRNVMAHDVPADPEVPEGELVSFLHCFPIGTQAGQESLRVPLRIGGRTAVVLPVFDAELLCVLVAGHRVRRLQLVPAMGQILVSSGAPGRHDVSSVRRVILSSAPAPPSLFARLAEAFPKATVWNAYALTEAGSARTLTQFDPSRPTAVGRPVGETEIRIVDGEIWLRRKNTPTRFYFRDPEATADVFVDGWVRTGDLGFVDEDGYLYLTDRQKDLIISGGSNVSSVEVENVLYEHPAVVEAAVFGIPHSVLGEDVAAAVVLRGPATERELQDVVRARLAEYKVPHTIAMVDSLPRNPSGKVVKGELRGRFGAAQRSPFVAPRDDTEAAVAKVWADVLGLSQVGATDDFFALGGHSLAAAQIVARVEDAFGISLPVAAVFDSPTVAELAHVVKESAGQATPRS